jgi:hypothetical protein
LSPLFAIAGEAAIANKALIATTRDSLFLVPITNLPLTLPEEPAPSVI